MRAIDVMATDVVSVAPDTPVKEIARLMVEKSISALPVLDDGRLVGIVSEGDLLRRIETGTERHRARWIEALSSNAAAASEYVKQHGRKAADVMTRDVVTLPDTASLDEVAGTLESNRIKRVPLMRDGAMVGIVSRANLVQALASRPAEPIARQGDDIRIRERLLTELRRHRWAEACSANVVVNDGVVHLWGVALSEPERNATRVAAENTWGVRRVVDHMTVLSLATTLNP